MKRQTRSAVKLAAATPRECITLDDSDDSHGDDDIDHESLNSSVEIYNPNNNTPPAPTAQTQTSKAETKPGISQKQQQRIKKIPTTPTKSKDKAKALPAAKLKSSKTMDNAKGKDKAATKKRSRQPPTPVLSTFPQDSTSSNSSSECIFIGRTPTPTQRSNPASTRIIASDEDEDVIGPIPAKRSKITLAAGTSKLNPNPKQVSARTGSNINDSNTSSASFLKSEKSSNPHPSSSSSSSVKTKATATSSTDTTKPSASSSNSNVFKSRTTTGTGSSSSKYALHRTTSSSSSSSSGTSTTKAAASIHPNNNNNEDTKSLGDSDLDHNPCGSVDSFTHFFAKFQSKSISKRSTASTATAPTPEATKSNSPKFSIEDEDTDVDDDDFSVSLSLSPPSKGKNSGGSESKNKSVSSVLSPTYKKVGAQSARADELCNEVDELLGGRSHRNRNHGSRIIEVDEDADTDEDLEALMPIPSNEFQFESSFTGESEVQEFNVRIRWKGTILKFPMKETDTCYQLRLKLAQKVSLNPQELLITFDDEEVPFPDTQTLRDAKIQLGTVLNGATRAARPGQGQGPGHEKSTNSSSSKSSAPKTPHNPNLVRIKCQSSDRKSSVEFSVDGKMGTVSDIIVGYALKMGIQLELIKCVKFDGEVLDSTDGLGDLELEGGECFDVFME